ncbi:MAG: SHOCT domain-containing protein [Anaerolineae bacterium]|nr:SHOCT domain-containing protein [Anaerolineae bacterium]
MMGFGFMWMLLSWAGVILLAVWLITVLFPTGPQPSFGNGSNSPGKARDILDQRYARGELSQAQYDEMRQTLGQ